VEMSWPRDRRVGEPVPVVVEVLSDPGQRFHTAALFWREGGEENYRRLPIEVPKAGAYTTVELPAHSETVRSDRIRQLYLSVFDQRGNEIWRLADGVAPREIALRYDPEPRWYERWWVWTAVGTALAAGTAAWVIRDNRTAADNATLGVEVTP
ncbi:MAG: hypothetical protein AAFY60_19060, partial [Myxococcota bacterium]